MSTEAMKRARDALGLYTRTLAPTETQKKGMEAITALDEALAQPQQELEYCTDYHCAGDCGQPHNQEEMQEFLASRPQPEPVAWMHTNAIGHVYFRKNPQDKTLNPVPLYTSPPARKPLTDEEIETVWRSVQANDFHDCVKPFARAIEAAHGIKENP